MSQTKKTNKGPRELIHSITRDDFRWDYYRPSGNGGQKVQKTSSACRCTHVESGAVGQCQDTRDQAKNRREAFRKCVNTTRFKTWHLMELCRLTGKKTLEEEVEFMMQAKHLKIEIKDENGRWIEIHDMLLD